MKLVVQTTGDLLTDAIVDDLLARGVWMISVASVDDFHVGLEGPDKQDAFTEQAVARCSSGTACADRASSAPRRATGTRKTGRSTASSARTPDSWIGKLWPRGRAWQNDLSTATTRRQLLQPLVGRAELPPPPVQRLRGVGRARPATCYPCCVKTKLPVGNLLEDRPDRHPRLAGRRSRRTRRSRWVIPSGWGSATAGARTRSRDVAHGDAGRAHGYQNLCIGCDRFHEEVLGPRLAAARAPASGRGGARRARRRSDR